MPSVASRDPQDHLPQSPARAGRVALLLRTLWARGVLQKPDLAQLRAKAAEVDQAGQCPSPWRKSLEALLDSLAGEARLNEIGLTFAYVQLSRLLRQRERAARLWQRQPEILQLPIEAPVIVLGQMRSGTTRLQRLLGCDPRLNHTRFHEVMNPAAVSTASSVTTSWAQLALLNLLSPEGRVVHPTSATAVEEAFGLLSVSFYGAHFEAQWRVPGFTRYWEQQDRTWVYREFRRLLQTIAWRRGAGAAKPWVLKAPQFMEDLEALLEVFPDARLICLHRPLGQVVASSASLVWHQMKLQTDAVDRRWIGAEWLRKTARRQHRCAAVRAARPDVPQIDTQFAALDGDWVGEMRRIYAFLGLALTPEVERRMARYLARAETSGFRQHTYQPADFGLDAERVRDAVGSDVLPATSSL